MRSLGSRRKYRTANSSSIGRIDQWNGVIKSGIVMRCNNSAYSHACLFCMVCGCHIHSFIQNFLLRFLVCGSTTPERWREQRLPLNHQLKQNYLTFPRKGKTCCSIPNHSVGVVMIVCILENVPCVTLHSDTYVSHVCTTSMAHLSPKNAWLPDLEVARVC